MFLHVWANFQNIIHKINREHMIYKDNLQVYQNKHSFRMQLKKPEYKKSNREVTLELP